MVERSDVLAAAAPISGGINIPYDDVARPIPTMVYWGGDDDSAYEQDFNGMSLEMIDTLSSNAHPVVACNHNSGHNIYASYFDDIMPYLLAHTLESIDSPYSDTTEGLGSNCFIP